MTATLLIPALLFGVMSTFHQFRISERTAKIALGKSEPPQAILDKVKKAQAALQTISYTMERTDTLVTGDVRTMRGKVKLQVAIQDSIFGFKFVARKDSEPGERIYDGHVGYETYPGTKTYRLLTEASRVRQLLNGGGGHLVLEDLVRINTSQVTTMHLREDAQHYYLTFNYRDLEEYDVRKRYKVFTIAKSSLLPVALRSHQETLGKIQDLSYRITGLLVNDPAFSYNFSELSFLKDYNQVLEVHANRPVMNLKDKPFPPFALRSFGNDPVSSAPLKGQVVLLDFWEVWCSPCIEALPKMEQLYSTYKKRGLQVYGIVNDLKQLEAAKALVRKRGLSYAMLIGNEALRKDYHLTGAVPLYILIDKKGQVRMISEGFPAELEAIIQKVLTE
ncbi:TlpA family protein disulfide reductase [Adhaeribacter swui]|uniref:TlpA family protein disulfide reductase n=1 Tax=Adhaeribacter swui TaxID=2086471 RepID=A0A7G7GB68_9BACT|nr:TlpA disulfide reductase family protein [Adhaeribacter swui]QNF34402.1 TlpA family protein disulfide reductase [Adhaeribacter swui]